MIQVKYSHIQYGTVAEMIRGLPGLKEEKRQEEILMSVYKVMIPVVMIAIIYVTTFILNMCCSKWILMLFGDHQYANGCMITALLMVGVFRFTFFRRIEANYIFPKVFPIRMIRKVGDCFIYEDLMLVLKVQEKINEAEDVSLNIRNGAVEVMIYMHDRSYRYVIPPNKYIPKTFYDNNNIDFSWLDLKLKEFEKKYHVTGLLLHYIS